MFDLASMCAQSNLRGGLMMLWVLGVDANFGSM